MSMRRGEAGYRSWVRNAWISVGLLASIVFLGNRLARRHSGWRVDLSEDQLYAPSEIGLGMVDSLQDVLLVKVYFTGEVKLGSVQIAKRRLIDQLDELVSASAGRMSLQFADPNGSSEARVEADRLGIPSVELSAMQGTSEVTQEIFLGMALYYRGREAVVPFVLPQYFEYAFLSELRRVLRDQPVGIGFLVGDGRGVAEDPFLEARALLARRYDCKDVLDLERGESIPEDVRVLIVADPTELHPRVVFAVDQFLQAGGRALLLLDRYEVDLTRGAMNGFDTGLGDLLRAWGIRLSEGLVWDQERSNTISTVESVDAGGRSLRGQGVRVQYPFWPHVDQRGLDDTLPVTRRLPGADLFWASALEVESSTQMESIQLLRTSELSWILPPEEAFRLDPKQLNARGVALLAAGDGQERNLALSLYGSYESPFAEGAPAVLDEYEEVLYAQARAQALAEGREVPERELARTSEDVASLLGETQVVVVGDADWARDGKFFTDRNKMFFENIVDWLALEDELVSLRSRVARERNIVDLLAQEREELGLFSLSLEESDDATISGLEETARRRATRRRWTWMLAATASSLVLGAVVGALVRGAMLRVPGGRLS